VPLYREIPTINTAHLQELRLLRSVGGKFTGEVAYETNLGSRSCGWDLTTQQKDLIVSDFLPDAMTAIGVEAGELGVQGSVQLRNVVQMVFRRAGDGDLLGRARFRYSLGVGGPHDLAAWAEWTLAGAQKQTIVQKFLQSAKQAAQLAANALAA